MNGPIVEVGVYVAGGVLLALAIAAGVWMRRFGRKAGLFFRDFYGEPSRPGVPARPGVMERLQKIEATQDDIGEKVGHVHYELKPNGGWSAKDQLNRLDPAYPPPVVTLAVPGGD